MSDLSTHYFGKNTSNDGRDPFDLFTVLMAILVFVLYTVVFCSCTRTEYITTEVHDTLRVEHHDTLVHERIKETVTILRDSVSHTEEYRHGDGIDTLVIHDIKIIERTNNTVISDSTLRAVVDSVAKSLHRTDTPSLPKPAEKPLTFWQQLYIFIGKFSLLFIISFFITYSTIKRNWLSKFIALLRRSPHKGVD